MGSADARTARLPNNRDGNLPFSREAGWWTLLSVIPGSAHQPRYRTILAVDIEGSTTRNNGAKARARDVMYDLVAEALRVGDIDRRLRDPFIDRGDGLLALIHPADRAPKTVLLDTVVPALSQLLAWYNAAHPADRLRLRAVVHAGEVHFDSRAPFGAALDVAFRLLDALELKRALHRTAAPLVLVVSGDLYQSVVRHGYAGIDPRAFTPLVNLRVAGVRQCGWLHLPRPRQREGIEGDATGQDVDVDEADQAGDGGSGDDLEDRDGGEAGGGGQGDGRAGALAAVRGRLADQDVPGGGGFVGAHPFDLVLVDAEPGEHGGAEGRLAVHRVECAGADGAAQAVERGERQW